MRCKQCGRNYRGEKKRGLCPICAKMDYSYSQGAITPKAYKKWEKEWLKS